MSRRKQGRPQQRLTLDAVEQENDLLVCGDCQTNFKLRDITKFIRHKVNRCNKENIKNEGEAGDGADDEDAEAIISTKRTPISAPIARKESSDISRSPRQALEADVKREDEEDDEEDEKEDVKDRQPLCVKQVVDAESNTTNSEPLKVTCETCRKPYCSAWSLVQHAQKEHGMRIYVTSSRDSYTPFQSPRGLQRSPKSDDHCSDKSKDGKKEDKERSRSDSTEPNRTTPSAGSVSSGEGPLSGHPSPHNPFMFPRMPFPDPRHPLSPITLRPPGLDFPGDPFSHHRGDLPGMFGLPGFPPSHSAPFHPFEPRSRMSLDDFYSQRLRQLASSSSPSPGRKHTPPFTQASNIPPRGPGMFPSLTPPSTNSVDIEKRAENSRSLTPPGNHKSCEFCGKTFRFQSNLIVHRRSHTGEKPFKCPLCPHACTQQSKLKRHMKTHVSKMSGGLSIGSNTSSVSEGSHASSSSTPDSNKIGNEEDEDADDDEEEEEEEIEEDDLEMEALDQLREERRLMEDKERKENEQKSLHGRNDLAARLFDQRIEETITSELSKDSESGDKKSSLITEVMENTGLRNIPNYNEALKLAIAEKYADSPLDERSRESLAQSEGSHNDDKSSKEEDRERGIKRDKPMDSSIMSISKMIKKEPNDKSSTPPVSAKQMMNNMESSFYPSLWFPGPTARPPEFFPQFPLRYSMGESIVDMQRNGFGLTSTNSSDAPMNTLSSPSGSTPTTPIPINGTTQPNSTPRKDKPRNDTCEYCGKIFKNCSNLTVHRRSHTGEKPYKCLLCSYACAQSSKLTRHMKTHGRFGKDVYKCKFCGMPFSVPSTLEKHMRKCVENTNMDAEDTGSNSDAASTSDSLSAMSLTTASMSLPSTPMSLASTLGFPMPFSVPGALEKNMRKILENSMNEVDVDDTSRGSNSDAASASETSHSDTFTSSTQLMSVSRGLPIPFSMPIKLDKHHSKAPENNGEGKGDESSDSLSIAPSSDAMSFSSSLVPQSLGLPANLGGLSSKRMKGDPKSSNNEESDLQSSPSASFSPSLGSQSSPMNAGLSLGLSANLSSMSSSRVKLESNMSTGIPLGMSSNLSGMSATGIKLDANRGTSSTSI